MDVRKENIRFTFDCPIDLHTVAKMKAAAQQQSMREYLIGLLARDVAESSTAFLSDEGFKEEVQNILQKDSELMKKLADQ